MVLGGGGNCGIAGIRVVTGGGGGGGKHSSTTDELHPFKLGFSNEPHTSSPEITPGLGRGLTEGS